MERAKKVASSVLIAAMTFAGLAPLNNVYAVTGGFLATQTQAATPVGAFDNQDAVTATTQPNQVATAATATSTVVGDLLATADGTGTAANGYTVTIVTGGADATGIIISAETLSTITATVETDGAGVADPTWADVVIALNAGLTFGATLTSPTNGLDTVVAGDVQVMTLAGAVNAQAQINTVTIAPAVEAGDVYTVTVGAFSASFTATTTSPTDVAAGLNTAIQNVGTYGGQDFISSTAVNVVTLTAKVAGTGFTQTSSATNKVATAQIVTFTPSSPTDTEVFRATIGGTNYEYTVVGTKTVKEVVEALEPLMEADAATTCAEDDTKITCTADVVNTSFTFATTVRDVTAPTVALTSVAPNPLNATFAVTVTFSESVTGFIVGDISVTNATLSNFVGSGAVYTVDVTPSIDGTVTVDVAAAVAQDAAANNNLVAPVAISRTADLTGPVAGTVNVPAGTYNTAQPVTITPAGDAVSTYYTIDGSTPDNTKTSGLGPVAIDAAHGGSVTLKYISYDSLGNASGITSVVYTFDKVSPVVAQVTPISVNTSDTTPNYTFSSTEAGTITYGGSCASGTPSASAGSNTVTFNALSAGTYENCTIRVTDAAGNQGNTITVSTFTVLTGVTTVTLKQGWNVFSTPNTLSAIAFSNSTGTGLTFYKLEGGIYSLVSSISVGLNGTIVPLVGFLVNNTSGADVNVFLTAQTGLTAPQKLRQLAVSAGWNILGTMTNTTPFDTIGVSATSKIDLTNGASGDNAVHTSFSAASVYQTGEAYGVFMSANGIYGGNE